MSDRQPLASENLTSRPPRSMPSRGCRPPSFVIRGNIRKQLAQNAYDSLTHVAILEDVELVGVLTIEELFSAREDVVVGDYGFGSPSGCPGHRSGGRRLAGGQTRRGPRGGGRRGQLRGLHPAAQASSCCSGSTRRTWIVWVLGNLEARGASQEPATALPAPGSLALGRPRGALLSADIMGAFENN